MAVRFTPAVLWTVIIVAIVAGSAGGVVLYYHNQPAPLPTPRVAADADNVTVDYIGTFGSGPEAGKVFDTSYYSVASNNATWPKAIQFQLRGGPKNYSALPVHVGAGTPSSGYTLGNLTYIGVVTGFWQGLLGLSVNTPKMIVVPPDLGYGPLNPACVATRPLVETIPVLQTMTPTVFGSRFPGVTASEGAVFSEPRYGWPVLILSVNSSAVVIDNLAEVNDRAAPAGWPVVVTQVSGTANGSGLITLQNELSPSDAGHLQGFDFQGNGPCSSSYHGRFIVTNVDLVHGTYTENFNQEVQGQTLIFQVVIVAFAQPAVAVTG